MKEKSAFRQLFDSITKPVAWSDELLKATEITRRQKSMPQMYYEENNQGQYSYFNEPTLIDPSNHRSLIYGGYAAHNFIELFHCIPEIFAPIHAIASRIANADFQLRKWFNDEIVYNNADWNRLYETPNPLQHFRELIYEAVVYEVVTGNEFMYTNTPSTLSRDYKNVSAIWNLPADKVEIVYPQAIKLFSATSIDDLITEYRIDNNNRYKPSDVLHIKSTNLRWNDRKLKGISPLLSADKAIANLIAVYEARNVIYTKRGALGAIVSRKSDESGLIPLTPKEKDLLREDFDGSYGLQHGKSPFVISNQPVDFIRFGMSIQELEPFTETYLDAKMIYSVLGVPEDLMPNETGATYENQVQAERRLYNSVIIPKANMYMQSLSNQLGLTNNRLYLHASFEAVSELQENKKDKATTDELIGKIYLQRFKSGVCTINDWIVATGGEKDKNPLCDKKIFEMEDVEIAKLVGLFRVSNNPNTPNGTTDNNTGG